jgi:hypothetical protein
LREREFPAVLKGQAREAMHESSPVTKEAARHGFFGIVGLLGDHPPALKLRLGKPAEDGHQTD